MQNVQSLLDTKWNVYFFLNITKSAIVSTFSPAPWCTDNAQLERSTQRWTSESKREFVTRMNAQISWKENAGKKECIRSILPIAQKSAHVHFVALLCVVVHIQDWWFHTKNVYTFFSTKNSLHASDSSCERTCVQLKDCKLRVAVVERWQKTLLGESVNSLKQTIIQKVVGTRQAMNKTLHMHEPACNATPTLTKP